MAQDNREIVERELNATTTDKKQLSKKCTEKFHGLFFNLYFAINDVDNCINEEIAKIDDSEFKNLNPITSAELTQLFSEDDFKNDNCIGKIYDVGELRNTTGCISKVMSQF